MPPKSKTIKKSSESSADAGASSNNADNGNAEARGKPSEQKMFMHLPLNVFRNYTNIRDLVTSDLQAKKGKSPLEIEIKKEIEKRHRQLKDPQKWQQLSLHRLRWLSSDTE